MKAAMAFSVILAAASAGYCAQGEVKDFPAAGIKEIMADTGAGAISAAGGLNNIRVEVTDSDPAKCLITLKAEGSKFIVKAEGRPDQGTAEKSFWKRLFSKVIKHTADCRAGFIIGAPSALSLNANTGSGSIQLSSFDGDIKADAGSGSIALTKLSGTVLADTGSGNITGTLCSGAFKGDTGSGSIDVSGLGGNAAADTGSGSVSLKWLKAPASGKALADTGSGSITMTFPADASLNADLKTGSGKIINEFGAGGKFAVSAETGSGGISILKAD